MDNLPPSPPSSFFLPMHVEQEALHSIQQKDNDNYGGFMAFRDKAFEIHMGELCEAKMFLDIDVSVDDGEPFDVVEE
jgi:hypothetical protein